MQSETENYKNAKFTTCNLQCVVNELMSRVLGICSFYVALYCEFNVVFDRGTCWPELIS